MKIRLTLSLTLCLFVSLLSAQGYLTITGIVLDKKSKAPLAYAHVGIPERGIGTTTGRDGEFILKVPARYSATNMIVSYIGYSTYRKSIQEIKGSTTIYMEQTPSELIEVVVMGESAVENIIRKAVANIPKNYPTHPTTNLGFYRESRTDDSLNFIYLAEGVLNVYKTSYTKSKEGMIGLVQGRKLNLENPLDTTFSSQFSSGHMAPHRFDFVKNRVDFIDERFFPVYKYWVESMTTYNDRPVYIIGFDVEEGSGVVGSVVDEYNEEDGGTFDKIARAFSKKKKKQKSIKGRMKGRIYVDQESYAFLRAEFEITKEGLKKYNYYPWYAGSWDGNSYVTNYRQLGDKWYFSNAIREGLYGGGGTYNNEIMITEINEKKSGPIPYMNRLEKGQTFTRMTGEYDDDFWKSYNVTPLSEELAESVQQLAAIQKAREAFSNENMDRIQQQKDSLKKLETLRLEELTSENPEEEYDYDFEFIEPRIIRKKKRDYPKVKFYMGLGTHLISSDPGRMGITYQTDGSDAAEVIVSVEEDVSKRSLEIILPLDLEYYFHKNFFIRGGFSLEFYNSIYKERSIGLGTQLNLSKQRPVLFRAMVQHSNFRYARKVGQAVNHYGDFEVDGKKFNANKVNLYYGSRTHNLKFSAELGLELNRHNQLYLRGTYYMPFSRRQDVWFHERGQVFRKKRHLPVSDSRVLVTQNGEPFEGPITPDGTFMITFGMTFF